MAISRRLFLGASIGAFAVRPRRQPPVCIFLRGGADGLSMVVPHVDQAYHAARPTTAIPPTDVLDLDDRCGLHPALAALTPFWVEGRLSIVRDARLAAIGTSHAAAQARVSALLTEAGVPVIDSWGWDTHFQQGAGTGTLATRMQQLAHRIASLAREGRSVFTVSEFGRTLRENRIGGTDHAPEVAMLLVGRRSYGIMHEPSDMRGLIRQFATL